MSRRAVGNCLLRLAELIKPTLGSRDLQIKVISSDHGRNYRYFCFMAALTAEKIGLGSVIAKTPGYVWVWVPNLRFGARSLEYDASTGGGVSEGGVLPLLAAASFHARVNDTR